MSVIAVKKHQLNNYFMAISIILKRELLLKIVLPRYNNTPYYKHTMFIQKPRQKHSFACTRCNFMYGLTDLCILKMTQPI